MSQPVILKSNPHGIDLILDDKIPFSELKQEILKKFKDLKIFTELELAIIEWVLNFSIQKQFYL